MGAYDDAEYWPAHVVASYLRLGSTRAARTQMDRWGVPDAPLGPSGERRWRREDVCEAAARRPGRGHRTDIQRPNAAYVAAMLLDAITDTVDRAWLRAEWVRRYPEDRESRYPDAVRTDLDPAVRWRSDGTYAAKRVKAALHQLERAGAIRRDPTTVTVLDRQRLADIASRIQHAAGTDV